MPPRLVRRPFRSLDMARRIAPSRLLSLALLLLPAVAVATRPFDLADLPVPSGYARTRPLSGRPPAGGVGPLLATRFLVNEVFESYGQVYDILSEFDSLLQSNPETAKIVTKGPGRTSPPHSIGSGAGGSSARDASGSSPAHQEHAGSGNGRSLRQLQQGPFGIGSLVGAQSVGGSNSSQIFLNQYPTPAWVPLQNNTNVTLIILAPNRTRRPDPLNRMAPYTGGWDFFNGHYWASLTWSSVAPSIIGLAWALFGLGFVAVLLCMCICCRDRWDDLRDDSLKYSNKQLMLPLIFMLFGIATACTGFGMMVTGGVKFKSASFNATDFAVQQLTGFADVMSNVTYAISGVNASVPAKSRSNFDTLIAKANNASQTIRDTAQWGGSTVKSTLNTINLILFIIGCITVGFALVALLFGLLKWVVPSNICTTLLWMLTFTTWILVTVFLFTWMFNGDTEVAMGQVASNPAARTTFSMLAACADPAVATNLATYSRYVAAVSIGAVNATISTKAPTFWVAPNVRYPKGLCQPYRGATYLLKSGICTMPPAGCVPSAPATCRPRVVTIQKLASMLPAVTCNDTSPAGTCLDEETASTVLATSNLISNLDVVLDPLAQIFRCSYVAGVAQGVQAAGQSMQTGALYLWIGYLLISTGTMIFAVCLPIYAYRAARSYGSHGGDESDGDGDEYEHEDVHKGSHNGSKEYDEDDHSNDGGDYHAERRSHDDDDNSDREHGRY